MGNWTDADVRRLEVASMASEALTQEMIALGFLLPTMTKAEATEILEDAIARRHKNDEEILSALVTFGSDAQYVADDIKAKAKLLPFAERQTREAIDKMCKR